MSVIDRKQTFLNRLTLIKYNIHVVTHICPSMGSLIGRKRIIEASPNFNQNINYSTNETNIVYWSGFPCFKPWYK